MSTVLVITDSPADPKVSTDLGSLGHSVWVVNRARLAEAEVYRSPDLILLDLDDPRHEMAATCRDLRAWDATRRAPILTLLPEELLRDLDFSCGIDDFLAEPYSLREIEARVRQMLRREGRLNGTGILKVGQIVINLTRYEVRVRGAPVELTLKEYELLKHLVKNRGRVFTRSNLLNEIWGYNYYGGIRTVDVHIRRVRSKLEGAGENYIRTIRGVGYQFEPAPVEDDEAQAPSEDLQ